jgi:hypothetical protein
VRVNSSNATTPSRPRGQQSRHDCGRIDPVTFSSWEAATVAPGLRITARLSGKAAADLNVGGGLFHAILTGTMFTLKLKALGP